MSEYTKMVDRLHDEGFHTTEHIFLSLLMVELKEEASIEIKKFHNMVKN